LYILINPQCISLENPGASLYINDFARNIYSVLFST
jgi:hypothetical protein